MRAFLQAELIDSALKDPLGWTAAPVIAHPTDAGIPSDTDWTEHYQHRSGAEVWVLVQKIKGDLFHVEGMFQPMHLQLLPNKNNQWAVHVNLGRHLPWYKTLCSEAGLAGFQRILSETFAPDSDLTHLEPLLAGAILTAFSDTTDDWSLSSDGLLESSRHMLDPKHCFTAPVLAQIQALVSPSRLEFFCGVYQQKHSLFIPIPPSFHARMQAMALYRDAMGPS